MISRELVDPRESFPHFVRILHNCIECVPDELDEATILLLVPMAVPAKDLPGISRWLQVRVLHALDTALSS